MMVTAMSVDTVEANIVQRAEPKMRLGTAHVTFRVLNGPTMGATHQIDMTVDEANKLSLGEEVVAPVTEINMPKVQAVDYRKVEED